MERTSEVYKTYVEILNRELVCAMGCTEPIAIAYCAAAARKALGCLGTVDKVIRCFPLFSPYSEKRHRFGVILRI